MTDEELRESDAVLTRIAALRDEMLAMLIDTMGGRFTAEEQAYYDTLCAELDALEPPPPAEEMRRAGAAELPLFGGEG